MTRSLIFSSFVFPLFVCSVVPVEGDGDGEGEGALVDEQAAAVIMVQARKAVKNSLVFDFKVLTSRYFCRMIAI
ncbi:hypothetical protein [Paenibacillus daejeonensis]|uniref:hypothetical protein n=1 Tax=Paenibacillus daejeonensis TaxID=135193 RepID=UPI00037A74CD|nr:hypothetical protein [Paenibacillus daejeonensis]